MTENKNYLWIAIILVISIIGQVVSYVAVDHILERVLGTPAQVVVTVSGNEAETITETGQISRVDVKVDECSTKQKDTGFGMGTAQNEVVESVLTPAMGVNWYGQQKETYYNLPMDIVVQYAHNRGIEGEYHVDERGVKYIGEYIMIAANQQVHPYGSLVETSLGTGIVVDTGGFALYNPQQVDIAVNW